MGLVVAEDFWKMSSLFLAWFIEDYCELSKKDGVVLIQCFYAVLGSYILQWLKYYALIIKCD